VRTAHEELLKAARMGATSDPLVIAFADSHHTDLTMNWLVALALAGVSNYLVIALDRQLYGVLAGRGIPSMLWEVEGGDLEKLWVERARVFGILCEAGVDFIHSDVDAIWLRAPRRQCLSDQGYDLIASQGTVWPSDAHNRFGFVLCCGFFRLRSTIASQRLMSELVAHIEGTRNDQVSLNRLLVRDECEWSVRKGDAYRIEFRGKRLLCSKSLMTGRTRRGPRVAVLPLHLFQRLPMRFDEEPFVAHLLTASDPLERLRQMAERRCLFLRADWRDQDFDVHSLTSLRPAQSGTNAALA
jgi:Nucleotide-diphospho-sugar transferase